MESGHCKSFCCPEAATFDKFTTDAYPTTLFCAPEDAQKITSLSFFAWVINPHLGQALIKREFTCGTSQILTLDAGTNTLRTQPVHPQRCHDQTGSLYEAWHGLSIAA